MVIIMILFMVLVNSIYFGAHMYCSNKLLFRSNFMHDHLFIADYMEVSRKLSVICITTLEA